MVKTWSEMSPPVSVCQRCQARLGPGGAPAFATLRLEKAAVCREDLCRACFEAMAPRPTTFWRRAQKPDAAPPATRDRRRARTARLLELFLDLAPGPRAPTENGRPMGEGSVDPTEQGEPIDAKRKLRYLTALALVRRRRLTLLRTGRGAETDTLVVRLPGSPEQDLVECPRIDPGELEPLLASLGQALEGGLGSPGDEKAPTADAPGEEP